MANVLTDGQLTKRQLTEDYSAGEERPLRGYVTMMAIYGTLVAGTAAAAGLRGKRLPETLTPYEVALVAAATHKVARTLTKAAVTSPVRAPLTRYAGPAGPAEISEEARHDGPVKHAAGELLTCPFCMDAWVATAFGLGLVCAPRLTRLVAGVCTALSGADFLQLAYARAQAAASG
jgi:hypothetical protein